MASAPEPEELSREELEAEIMRLRGLEGRVERLETLVGTLGDTPPDKAGLQDVALAGEPIGKLVDENIQRFKQLESEVQAGERGQPRLGGSLDEMVAAHRMWGDLITGAGHSLNRT